MERRSFLKKAGAGLAAGAIAAPAIGQGTQPEVKWRMAASWPKSLDTIFGGAELISKRCASATNGKFQIQVFAAGEIVPGLQVLDAVQNATVQCCHTAPYYFFGKDPTFAFACAIPFGLNCRQQNAWMYHGGGLELMREFMKDYNVHNIPAGNTGAQMGGFFRKELKTVADMQGLKMRIGGSAGVAGIELDHAAGHEALVGADEAALRRLSVIRMRRQIDAEKRSLDRGASWEALPKDYQSILESACAEANVDMVAKYDALNPAALRRLVAAGVQLRPFPREIMQASHKAATEVYDEFATTNAKFKKIYEPWKKFRDEEILWFRVAEQNFDQFMATASQQSAAPAKKG